VFEVGDRVVCVDDSPVSWNGKIYSLGITRGEVFIVRAVFPNTHTPGWQKPKNDLAISIGRENQYYLAIMRELPVGYPHPGVGPDAWRASRFRKLRDISQSLSELKALTVNCPQLAEADA